MDVRFITPLAALFAASALVPLTAYALRARQLQRLREILGLAETGLRAELPLFLALAAVPVLLGVAAAQPVVETTRTVRERTDAQAFVVVDVSRSMLAAVRPEAPTRFERAQAIGLALRAELPDVPFGIASVTDRVLPHLFPTTDSRVFAATLEDSLGIEHPPPGAFYLTIATQLDSLRAFPEQEYFPPSARKRVVVVLTDGETEQPPPDFARAFRRKPPVETVFIRLWDAEERIYETGVAEGGYRPDPRSGALLERIADLAGGRVFAEDEKQEALGAVRAALGSGPTVEQTQDSGRLPLMPWVTLAALVPVVVVFLRRNLWWTGRVRVPVRRRRAAPAPEGATLSPARGVAQPG